MVEVSCKTCSKKFVVEEKKKFKNCDTCRKEQSEVRRARPKYNPETHRICRDCKEVKGIDSEFTERIVKRSNLCNKCRGQHQVENAVKSEEVDVKKVLGSVKKTLKKIMETEDVEEAISMIEEIMEGEDGGEVELDE